MSRLSFFICLSTAVLMINAHEHVDDDDEAQVRPHAGANVGALPPVALPPHVPGVDLSTAGPPQWTFTKGKYGPSNWGRYYPKCKLRNQSPINIHHDATILAFLKPINFKNLDAALTGANLQNLFRFGLIDFTGVQPRVTAEGGPLPHHSKYYLIAAYMIVGSNNKNGSQFSLDGEKGAFEISLTFGSDEHATLKTLDKVGSRVQISFKGKVGNENPGWTPIVDGYKKIVKGGSQALINLKSLRSILPRKPWTNNYYSMVGTLTVPPCTEAVFRILYERHIRISKQQLAALRGIRDENNKPIVNNFRKPKPSIHVQIFRSHLYRLPHPTTTTPTNVFVPTTTARYGYQKKKRTTTQVPNVAEEEVYAPYKKTTTTRRTTTLPPNVAEEVYPHASS